MISPIDMKYVYKRERYLEKKSAVNESAELDLDNINPNSTVYEYRINNFMKSNPSYQNILSLLEKVYFDDKLTLLESLTTTICNDYIPTIRNKDLPSFISVVENSNIGDINKDRLIENAKMYKSIDRIIKNHKSLTEKFSNYDGVFTNKAKSDKEKCFSICEFCDTYSISPFIKMNIALEEMMYRKYTEDVNITENSIIENTLDYFLLRDNNTKEDIDSYKRCIEESKVLSKSGKTYGLSLIENTNKNDLITIVNWESKLHDWKLSSNKSIDSIHSLIRENVNNLKALQKIVETCNDFINVNSLSSNIMDAFKSIKEVTGTEAGNIRRIINESSNIEPDELLETLNFIYEAEINTQTYNDYEDNDQTFTSSEIDKFRMQNLITDAKDAGEFLDQMEKSSMKESPLKFKQIINFSSGNLNINESNICDFVDNDDHISIKIKSYLYEGSLDDIKEFADSANKSINNMLYNRDTVSYYDLMENTLNFYIRSKYLIELTESEYFNRDLNISDKYLVTEFMKYSDAIDGIMESGIDLVLDKLNDRHYAATVSANEVALIAEIMSPYVTEECDFISNFLQLCKEEANPAYDYMKYLVSDIDRDTFNINEDHKERIGYCLDLMGLNEEDSNLLDKMKNNLKASVNDLNPLKNKDKKKDKKKKNEEEENKDDNTPMKASSSVDENKKSKKKNLQPVEDNEDEEENDKKSKVKKSSLKPEDEDEEEETPKSDNEEDPKDKKKKVKGSPINVNDAKLAWKSAKSKFKALDAKQADICKDMDMTFNRLMNTFDGISDPVSKEALITGKTKVSISKLIKSAIVLAGAGAASGAAMHISPLIVPIAAVVTMLGRSHYLSKKRKQELLDEIDIELKVLDRELARAEQDGSANKYRQLLAIQRTLQRKRQELYFNIAKSGKRLPLGANEGQQPKGD